MFISLDGDSLVWPPNEQRVWHIKRGRSINMNRRRSWAKRQQSLSVGLVRYATSGCEDPVNTSALPQFSSTNKGGLRIRRPLVRLALPSDRKIFSTKHGLQCPGTFLLCLLTVQIPFLFCLSRFSTSKIWILSESVVIDSATLILELGNIQ